MRRVCTALVGASLVSVGVCLAAAKADLRLVEAAKNRQSARARALVGDRVDVNVRQADGATALHWAAHWDDLALVELLVRAGADVNAANDLGVTPLTLAAENGSAAIVQRLLDGGARPNSTTIAGETALMTAVRSGSAGAVSALLQRGAQVNVREPLRGQTPLMWAVAQEHPEIVRLLIDHGADIRARSFVRPVHVNRGGRANGEVLEGGYTPVLFSARQGDIESARLLLRAGADPNDTGADGNSALVIAAHSGHGAFARYLLGEGANPNAAGAGYTALHAAVLRGDRELVEALLVRGGDANAPLTRGTRLTRNSKDWILPEIWLGATPLWLAAKFVELDMIRALAAAGGDGHRPIHDGTTPLMAAAGVGWGREAVDRHERTAYVDPLHPLDDRSTLEAVKLLLDLGSDLQAVNRAQDTALHGAAFKGFNRVVRHLVERGARVDAKNRRGLTALGALSSGGPAGERDQFEFEYLRETAALLRELGAKD
jgi:ankyrin repeat protein